MKYIIFLLFSIHVIFIAGCNNESTGENIKSPETLAIPDTALVENALRAFDSLPGRKDKAAGLDSIRQLAIDIGYTDQACFLSLDLARGEIDLGNFESGLKYYEEAKSFCYSPLYDKLLPAYYLAEYGAFYHSLRSDHVAANNAYYEALHYLEEKGLTENELAISLYIFLYQTQMKLDQQEQALNYLKQGEQLAEKLQSKQALAAIWGNLGDYYLRLEKYTEALFYFDKAIIYEDNLWDPNILTTALLGKANTLIETNRPKEALPVLEKAVEVSKREKIAYTEGAAIIALGSAYNKMANFRESIHSVRPIVYDSTSGYNNIREHGYYVLIEAYEGIGDFRNALIEQRNLAEWKDSLLTVEKTKAIEELELKYQSSIKDKELASQQLQIEQQKNKLNKRNAVIGFITLAALMSILLSALLYKSAIQRKKVSELQVEHLKKKQEIELLRSSMQGEEQERQRLSRELHDGIGSMISSAIMQLSLMKKEDISPSKQDIYQDVLYLLQDTGKEVRRTAHNMMPDTIHKQSLVDAVKNYTESITKGSNLTIDVKFYGNKENFMPQCKLVIYRIVQELVHNIVKHANATNAIVQGIMDDSRFSLTVEDNGKGFNVNADKRGIGLKNVASRVKSLNGDFQIESSPGEGTTVYMEFDCKQLINE